MSHQPALPGFPNPAGGRRREPRQRKGESWEGYATRHETWRRATFREKNPAERETREQVNREFREKLMAGNQSHCRRAVERAKEQPPHCAIYFWFGDVLPGRPGLAQYLNRPAVDHLVKKMNNQDEKIFFGLMPCWKVGL